MRYTEHTVKDLTELGQALASADRYQITAEILNHVVYLIVNQDEWRCKQCGDVAHPCEPCDQPTVSAQTQSQKSTTDQLLSISIDRHLERIASLESELAAVRGERDRETDLKNLAANRLQTLVDFCKNVDAKYNNLLPLLVEKDEEAACLRSQVVRLQSMLTAYHNKDKTNG